jgi:hypothetical protein
VTHVHTRHNFDFNNFWLFPLFCFLRLYLSAKLLGDTVGSSMSLQAACHAFLNSFAQVCCPSGLLYMYVRVVLISIPLCASHGQGLRRELLSKGVLVTLATLGPMQSEGAVTANANTSAGTFCRLPLLMYVDVYGFHLFVALFDCFNNLLMCIHLVLFRFCMCSCWWTLLMTWLGGAAIRMPRLVPPRPILH